LTPTTTPTTTRAAAAASLKKTIIRFSDGGGDISGDSMIKQVPMRVMSFWK
jgi:hypothetical protein